MEDIVLPGNEDAANKRLKNRLAFQGVWTIILVALHFTINQKEISQLPRLNSTSFAVPDYTPPGFPLWRLLWEFTRAKNLSSKQVYHRWVPFGRLQRIHLR